MQLNNSERPLFSTPDEELAYLRNEVEKKEKELSIQGGIRTPEKITEEVVKNYSRTTPSAVLSPSLRIEEKDEEAIILNLSPKKTDAKMGEVLTVLQEKGILSALQIVEKLNDPELEDDFHRFLVAYIKKGFQAKGDQKKGTIFEGIRMTLYEISLRAGKEDDNDRRPLKEVLSAMEQFYAGILSSDKERSSFAFEIAVSNENRDVIFYAAIPDQKTDLFEKQILAIFPDAKLRVKTDDYNIFSSNASVASSYARLKDRPIYPIKTYDQFDYDPLNVILNAFSKIAETGEGAAIQFMFTPSDFDYVGAYSESLKKIGKGEKLKDATDVRETIFGSLAKDVKFGMSDIFSTKDPKKEAERKEIGELERIALDQIKKKIESPIIKANVRLIVSAGDKNRADNLLSEFESSFNQFQNTQGNRFYFERIEGRFLLDAIRNFSFRIFDHKNFLPLSLREVTSLFHLPKTTITATPELKQSKASTAPAPSNISRSGILLGSNRFRGSETPVYFSPEDRLRHFYAIGQTGTGKSTLLKQMIIQDIKQGNGVCMIDPHGSDILEVLGNIPEERYDDVIYFDPSSTSRPMGLNMLEYDTRFPEQKTFVVNELISIFNKLFDMKMAGGPAFEQYFRNSALLVMEHPESGNTLVEIGRVISDKAFRDLKLSHCQNPIIKQFWVNAEKTTGETSLANFAPYVTSKFDNFLSNDIMRPIVAQQSSSFNFRNIMDEKKILLVNLSKGRLGDINANLIGLVLVGKILMAALSRVEGAHDLPPFYLYIDEFQNITTDSIATILSEARKYKLSLNIAHQFISQLEESIKKAVFGNVGSMAIFRLGAEDAEVLEKQLSPIFTAKDIMNLDNLNAYLRLLVEGKPAEAFNVEVSFPERGDKEKANSLKELSSMKYGKPREEVEREIMERFSLSQKLA